VAAGRACNGSCVGRLAHRDEIREDRPGPEAPELPGEYWAALSGRLIRRRRSAG